ncbi:hypothetical protein AB0M29_27800 [Streptomyces sp. NPDC051976]|uniref:hypothetical protein n=1 Tax=Streptomyces sp. NPDC051976 TaxID=3154947 RepID=UPI00341A407B
MTNTEDNVVMAAVPVAEVTASALELGTGGRWRRALGLLDATAVDEEASRVRLALTAAEVALESDWFAGTALADDRLSAAEKVCATADEPGHAALWTLGFLRLRHDYAAQIRSGGTYRLGPDGKDPAVTAELRGRAVALTERAPDEVRRGWAHFYLGLITENLFAERDAAHPHFAAALRGGEGPDGDGDGGDGLLAREALRHLGDHDHDAGRDAQALSRWRLAADVGARAGAVPGTLSQQLLLAVLARDSGDEAGAVALAGAAARWAAAIGADDLAARCISFLDGADPTALPSDAS